MFWVKILAGFDLEIAGRPVSSVAAPITGQVWSSNSEKPMRPIFEAAADRLRLGITAILAAADRYALAASERFS